MREGERQAQRDTHSDISMEPLSATMAFLRAAERVQIGRMEQCAESYPQLRTIAGPIEPNLRNTPRLAKVREHAVELARTGITEELS